ncbi:MAG: beta-galactosidase [Clostridia bacterium]|nr:beta-galactosidase [Clostridia bacterium]
MSTPVLRYGADYNPDQWLHRPDILAQDIELMKKANVNVVSLGIFAWATLEPAEGQYDLDWMAKIIDDLYAAGVSVDLATPSGARPAWMTRKYPEVLRVGKDRRRNLFGERHNHCYTSPVYREKVKLMNQQLASRFGRHPAVVMWHISNEYGGECHCDLCQQAFRDWLRAKYGTIEALNRAWNAKFWSHDYPDFGAVESPAPHGENSVHGLKLDWKRFVSHQTIDFMKWERDCIREIVPEAKVCTNMMYFYDGIDYFAMAKELDLATWDAYPTWHKPTETMEQTAMDTGFMHDLIYSVKGQPFWLMENCPGPTNWQPVSKGKKPGVNILAGMQTVAHGGDGVLFFQWRQAQGSSEKFHAAMVSHDCREDNRIYMECAELGSMLKELSANIAGQKREKQAAIVYDWSNKWALEDAQGPRNKGLGYKHELLRHYTGLRQNGIDVQMVNEDSDISGYKLIVAPMLYMLREDFAAKLREFVKDGGTLVCTYWSGVVNETDLCYLGDTPHDLTDVLGVRRLEIDAMYDGEQCRCVAVCDELPETATGSILCEVAALEGAKALMVYDEDYFAGAPAVTVNAYGEGKAYYVATRFEEEFYKPLYALIADGVVSSCWPGHIAEGVIACSRGDYVFLLNTTDAVVWFDNAELSPYATAIYKKNGDKLDLIYNQMAFNWSPVK